MAGIFDVAKLAGVSTATVSRALAGKDHVSAKAKAKVEAAAAELGYVASASAYTMATGRARNIGVVLPHVDRWFFSTCLLGAENILIEHGYDLTFYNLGSKPENRDRIFSEFLLRKRVDAVLTIAVRLSQEELRNLNRMKKPFIGIGGPIVGARSVSMDDFAAGKLATEHLIALGHTKIGNIGGIGGFDAEFNQPLLRRTGYQAAMDAANLEIKKSWIAETTFSIDHGYKVAKQMLGDPRNAPTAIFCSADEIAFGAIMAAKDLGLRVPEDVSIIGIDNHEMSEFFGLTTISQDVKGQGEAAAKMLIDILNGPDLGDAVNIEKQYDWPIELTVRSSTARPPATHR
jgi:DNA-binding LacI/PurR family transcriptional regulator